MSLNLFSRLMPTEEAFTPLFCEQAQYILEPAQQLGRMIGEDIPAEQHVAIIRETEMAADTVARKSFIGANRTFNAPIDRWPVAQRIVIAWVLTLPAAGLIGGLVFKAVSYF